METKYLKFNRDEVVFHRKELLSTEINLLHLIKGINNYRQIRQREFAFKTKLKSEIFSLKSKINSLKSSFPSEEFKKPNIKEKIKKINGDKPQKNKDKNFEQELESIKLKLAKLG